MLPGLTWKHVAVAALGVGCAVLGVVVPAAAPLLGPLAGILVGGALGHAK